MLDQVNMIEVQAQIYSVCIIYFSQQIVETLD